MTTRISTTSAAMCAVFGLMPLAGGCGVEDDGASSQASDEPVATSTHALASCAFGAGSYVMVGDYNGDGRKDVLSPNAGSVDTYIGSGPPSNVFNFAAFPVANTWGGAAFTFTGNFTGAAGARVTEIASANAGNVFLKLPGPPGFGWTSQAWPVPNSWGGAGFTWAADFTGDGTTDIATAIGGTINLFRSTRTSFVTTSSSVANAWGGAAFTFAADFNGDGKADIASANGGSVFMKLSNGSGFTSATWPVAANWGGGGFAFAADFNGDGKADIASANGGNVFLKLSTGSGFTSISAPVSLLWGGPGYVKVGDFTGDGKADIASFNGCAATLLESTGTGFVAHTS